MKSEHVSVSGPISLNMLLFAIFLVLKLIGKITWSWWWVTCPLWAPIALILVIAICCVILAKIFN